MYKFMDSGDQHNLQYYKHDWINLPPNRTFVDNLMDQEHFTVHDDKQMCLLLFSTVKLTRSIHDWFYFIIFFTILFHAILE